MAVGKLAGALSARLREGAKTTLDSVGPAATYTAIKSIMVAEDYCSQEKLRAKSLQCGRRW
ncbi:unnamed protein product [Effrenium voratum]|nr:unnamed protein product [Effrenium voratum]